MADIYQEAEALIASIKADFDKDPDRYIQETEPLTNDDLVLVGSVVQLYGFSDLNARRVIDRIRHAALGPDKQNGALIQDAQVYEKLMEAAEMLPDGNSRDGLAKAAQTLGMHVSLRHHFAHWATRRVKGQDALVMFTYNNKETVKRLGRPFEPDHLTFGVVGVAPIRAELAKLDGHSKWLAEEAARIATNFDALKKHFDDKKEADRAARYAAGKFKKRGKGGPQKS